MQRSHDKGSFLLFLALGYFCIINADAPYFFKLVISLNLVLAGLRLGLKNRQVGEKWASDDCSYLCKGLIILFNDQSC
jgi:hypothetical protein